MKKIFYCIIIIIILSLYGCESLSVNNNSTTQPTPPTQVKDIISANAKTTIEQNFDLQDYDITSFKDDNYYYFIFDLGKYYNIPIDGAYDYYYYGGVGDITKTMTASSTNANTIQSSISHTNQITTNFSATENLGLSVSCGFTPPEVTGGLSLNSTIEYGFSLTAGLSSTNAWTKTFEETSQYSKSSANTTSISFKTGDPAGYYYYYLSVDTQVYGTIIKNITTNEYYVTTYSSILGKGFNYVYCGQETLQISCEQTLDFNYEKIISEYNLDSIVPQTYITSQTVDDEIINDGKTHIKDNNPSLLHDALLTANTEIVLDTDIDLTDYNWDIIDVFNGTFNGNNHKITGFSKTRNSTALNSNLNWGLINKIGSKGIVKDLIVENGRLSTPSGNAGTGFIYAGFVAVTNEGLIENVRVYNSTISIERDKSCYGCIAAFVQNNGAIKNCDASAIFIFGNGDQGGIVGTARWEGYVNDCTLGKYDSRSTFWYWGTSTRSAGGIVGYCFGSYIINCGVGKVTFSFRGGKNNNPSVGLVIGCLDSGTVRTIGTTSDCIRDDVEVGSHCYALSYGMIGSKSGNNVIS